jgi:NitT/TauT family transport system substrate-binding protein
VDVVPVKFDTSPFLRGAVDAFPVFRNTQGIEMAEQLEKNGIKTNMVGPADHGVIGYSNLYFTTADFLQKHPDVVKAFIAGALKGWEYAQTHPDEAAEIVAKYDKENTIDVIKQSVRATNTIVKPSANQRIGNMTREGWLSTQNVLLQAKQLREALNIDKLFINTYVDDFYAHR